MPFIQAVSSSTSSTILHSPSSQSLCLRFLPGFIYQLIYWSDSGTIFFIIGNILCCQLIINLSKKLISDQYNYCMQKTLSQNHQLKIFLSLEYLSLGIKFPCSCLFTFRYSNGQTLQISKTYPLSKGKCIVNQTYSFEVSASYDVGRSSYEEKMVEIVVSIISSNGTINAGICNFDCCQEEHISCSLKKCSDKSAILSFNSKIEVLSIYQQKQNSISSFDSNISDVHLPNNRKSPISNYATSHFYENNSQFIDQDSRINVRSLKSLNFRIDQDFLSDQKLNSSKLTIAKDRRHYIEQNEKIIKEKQLERSNKKLEKRQKQLNLSIKELENHQQRLKSKIIVSEAKANQLKSYLDNKEKQELSQGQRMKELQQKLQQSQQRQKLLEKKINAKEQSSSEQIKKLSQKLFKSDSEIHQFAYNYNNLLQKFENGEKTSQKILREKEKYFTIEKNSLVKECTYLKEQLQKLRNSDNNQITFKQVSKEQKKLLQNIEDLQRELRDLKDRIRQQEQKNKFLSDQILEYTQFQSQTHQIRKKLSENEILIEKLEDKNESSKLMIKNQKQVIESQIQTFEKQGTEKKILLNTINQLTRSCEDRLLEIETLRNTLEECCRQKNEISEKESNIIKKLEEKINQSDETIKRLKQSIYQLQQQKENFIFEIQVLKVQNRNLSQQKSYSTTKLEKNEKQLTSLKEINDRIGSKEYEESKAIQSLRKLLQLTENEKIYGQIQLQSVSSQNKHLKARIQEKDEQLIRDILCFTDAISKNNLSLFPSFSNTEVSSVLKQMLRNSINRQNSFAKTKQENQFLAQEVEIIGQRLIEANRDFDIKFNKKQLVMCQVEDQFELQILGYMNEIQTLKEEEIKKTLALQKLQQEFNYLQYQMKQLKDEKTEIQKAKQISDITYKTLQRQYNDLEKQKNIFDDENKILKGNYEEEKLKVLEMNKRQNHNERIVIKSLQNKAKESEEENQKLKQRAWASQEKLNQLLPQMHKIEIEKEVMKQRQRQLQSKLKNTESMLEELKEETILRQEDQLRTKKLIECENLQLKKQKSKLSRKLSEMEYCRSSFTQQKQQFLFEINEKQTKIISLGKQLNQKEVEYEQKIWSLKEESNKQKIELDILHSFESKEEGYQGDNLQELHYLQNSINKLNQNHEQLNTNYEHCKEELYHSQQKYQELQQELEKKISQKNTSIEQANCQIKIKEEQLSSYAKKYHQLLEKISSCQEQGRSELWLKQEKIKDLEQKVHQKERQIYDIQNSGSKLEIQYEETISKAIGEIDRLTDHNEQQLQQIRSENYHLQNQIHHYKEEISQLKSVINNKNNSIEKMESQKVQIEILKETNSEQFQKDQKEQNFLAKNCSQLMEELISITKTQKSLTTNVSIGDFLRQLSLGTISSQNSLIKTVDSLQEKNVLSSFRPLLQKIQLALQTYE